MLSNFDDDYGCSSNLRALCLYSPLLLILESDLLVYGGGKYALSIDTLLPETFASS